MAVAHDVAAFRDHPAHCGGVSAAGAGVDDPPLDECRAAVGGKADFGSGELFEVRFESAHHVVGDGLAVDLAGHDAATAEVVPEALGDRHFLVIPEEAEALDDAVAGAQPTRQQFALEAVNGFLTIRGGDGFLDHPIVFLDQCDLESQIAFRRLEDTGIGHFQEFAPLLSCCRLLFLPLVGLMAERGASQGGWCGGCETKERTAVHGRKLTENRNETTMERSNMGMSDAACPTCRAMACKARGLGVVVPSRRMERMRHGLKRSAEPYGCRRRATSNGTLRKSNRLR